MTWRFCLTKLSEPGFEVYTNSEKNLAIILGGFVCRTCDLGDLDEVLASDCGAEFMLEEVEN